MLRPHAIRTAAPCSASLKPHTLQPGRTLTMSPSSQNVSRTCLQSTLEPFRHGSAECHSQRHRHPPALSQSPLLLERRQGHLQRPCAVRDRSQQLAQPPDEPEISTGRGGTWPSAVVQRGASPCSRKRAARPVQASAGNPASKDDRRRSAEESQGGITMEVQERRGRRHFSSHGTTEDASGDRVTDGSLVSFCTSTTQRLSLDVQANSPKLSKMTPAPFGRTYRPSSLLSTKCSRYKSPQASAFF
jgi:hypothetical protein